MEEKFGIETVKQALQIVSNEVNTTDAQLANGFQGTDLISIALQLTPVNNILQAKEEISNEWKDLSDDEIIECAKFFNANLNLRNKDTQEKIQKDIMAVAYGAIAVRGHLPKKIEPTV